MAYIPYGPQMPNFQGFGTGEANYGSAPYAEAAQQARFRLGTRDRILAALSGLSAVPRGANFGTAFLAAAGGSARATWAAKQAAMNYAQRQADQEIERQRAETYRMQTEAAIKEKPPKTPTVDIWNRDPAEIEKYLALKDRELAMQSKYRPQPSAKGGGAAGSTVRVTVPRVTPAERQALSYYNRAKAAEETIAPLEDKVARFNIIEQEQLRYAPNVMQTPDMQVYRQSQRAFTEARLRKESGAAIPQQEYTNDAKTYFAQPGDSPATVRAKRKARQVVLNGLKFASGGAYDEFYGGGTAPAPAQPQGGDTADLIYNPETGELEPAR